MITFKNVVLEAQYKVSWKSYAHLLRCSSFYVLNYSIKSESYEY